MKPGLVGGGADLAAEGLVCVWGADLAAEVLAEAGQALLMEAQQGEDLEEALHLHKVHGHYGRVQTLGHDHLQLLLRLLQQHQAGVHRAAWGEEGSATSSRDGSYGAL